MKQIIFLAGFFFAATLSADWPMFHRDPGFTGVANDEHLKMPLHQYLKINLGAKITAGPVIRGDTL